jgi:acyl-CoA synthetase (AMP-forming)/AMP-acid ligase II
MLGLMQQQPLMISSIIKHAARHHSDAEIVSKTVEGAVHRYTYADAERAARRLARAMQGLGVKPGDRVATLAWNGYRHFEIYYASSGMQAICHTINPRLHQDDITYILNHAGSCLLFSDTSFAPLIAAIAPRISEHIRAIVMMTDEAHMPAIGTPMPLLCYDAFAGAADEDYEWPSFDENTAASLCYTSGTTGRPKGVLYSHRSTILHAYAVASADAIGLRATDRLMPVVPMFHVNGWGTPYAAPMIGSALVMPGRHLDGESVATLMNDERVTLSAGVPTVWMGLLQYLRASGKRLGTVKRIITGGSACPPLLLEAFGSEYGITVEHAWGMTELSPVGSYNKPKKRQEGLTGEAWLRQNLKQGRSLFGIDMKIVDDDNQELPWDGVRFGELKVRGPWVASAYYGDPPGSACDENGWFKTGDVCTIDPDGFMEITDRSKDVIKSGGEWISSITLENIAVSHPDIVEAAVIAARHEKWDERPLLIVVPRDGTNVTPEAVLATYENKVPKWWLPDAVVLVDALPHTATGKLQKSALRIQYGNYLINAR